VCGVVLEVLTVDAEAWCSLLLSLAKPEPFKAAAYDRYNYYECIIVDFDRYGLKSTRFGFWTDLETVLQLDTSQETYTLPPTEPIPSASSTAIYGPK
jgi:hypothetical protein